MLRTSRFEVFFEGVYMASPASGSGELKVGERVTLKHPVAFNGPSVKAGANGVVAFVDYKRYRIDVDFDNGITRKGIAPGDLEREAGKG